MGDCFIQKSDKKFLLIKHAAELVTCAGPAPKAGAAMAEMGIITDGALLAQDGKIVWVGKTDELPEVDQAQCEIVDAAGSVYYPDLLIPTHTWYLGAIVLTSSSGGWAVCRTWRFLSVVAAF